MQFICKCGACSIYLKRKGTTDMVGAYCMDCGAWVKWVGKKDVNNLLKQGFIVHPESYVSPTIKLKQDQLAKDRELIAQVTNTSNYTQNKKVDNVENVELNLCCKNCGEQEIENVAVRKVSGTHTGVYCGCCGSWIKWLSKKQISYLESIGVDVNNTVEVIKKSNLTNIEGDAHKEDTFDEDYFAEYTEYDEDSDEDYDEELEEEFEEETSCDFCNGLISLEPIVESKVNLTYFGGVLSIINENETELLGSYKLPFCPRCGRNLSKK